MKITEDQYKCLVIAAEILMDIHAWSRESEEGTIELESMAGAGFLLLGTIALRLDPKRDEDTVSEFKTPYAGIGTTRTTDGGEEQGRARSFGDEGP